MIEKKFENFSSAFRYAIDNEGRTLSYFYRKIGMDSSQFNKYYNLHIKNPQPETKSLLNSLVYNRIKKDGKYWVLAEKSEYAVNNLNISEEQEVTTKTIGIDSIVQSKKEKIKEILIIARELEKNSNIALSDRSTTPDQKNQELTLILKILIKRFNKIMDDLEL